jgi:phosphotransferase system enzyme I (PtsI)
MFPMISCYDEVLHAKRILREAADSLDKEGLGFDKNIKIGIMIEIPSAVFMADVMARDVDFFSVGTNDLIQYSLAVDRVNKKVAHLFQPLNPAIIRMIKHVADVARDKGVNLFMCGEMASDPVNIPILLGLGIEKLSINPQSIPVIKNIIKLLDTKNAKLFIKEVLKETTDTGVTELVLSTYGNILFETGYTGI